MTFGHVWSRLVTFDHFRLLTAARVTNRPGMGVVKETAASKSAAPKLART